VTTNCSEAAKFSALLDVNGTVDADVSDFDVLSSGDIDLVSSANTAAAVYIAQSTGTSGTIKIHADTGTSVTEGAESISLLSDAGGVGIRSTANLANAVNITADGGTTSTIQIFNDQGTTSTEGAASIQLLSDVGGIGIKSGLNAAGAIRLTADAGTSETIILHADQGSGTDSIHLLSDAGGITLNPGTFVTVGGIADAEIRLFEDTGAGCNYAAIKVQNMAASYTLTLPADDGCCGEALTTNGSGVLTWAASGGGIPYSSATVAIIEATTGTHNDRIPSLYVTAKDSGNMADGFGPQIIFRATDCSATNQALGQMSFERSGADNTGKFRLQSKVAGSDNTLMVIYPTGEMQLPDQPSFGLVPDSGQGCVTGNGQAHKVTWTTPIWNIGCNWCATNDKFVAPVDGKYLMDGRIEMDGNNNGTQIEVRIITSNRTWKHIYKTAHLSANEGFAFSNVVDMDACDDVYVQIMATGESGGNILDVLEGCNRSFWTGMLIG